MWWGGTIFNLTHKSVCSFSTKTINGKMNWFFLNFLSKLKNKSNLLFKRPFVVLIKTNPVNNIFYLFIYFVGLENFMEICFSYREIFFNKINIKIKLPCTRYGNKSKINIKQNTAQYFSIVLFLENNFHENFFSIYIRIT